MVPSDYITICNSYKKIYKSMGEAFVDIVFFLETYISTAVRVVIETVQRERNLGRV